MHACLAHRHAFLSHLLPCILVSPIAMKSCFTNHHSWLINCYAMLPRQSPFSSYQSSCILVWLISIYLVSCRLLIIFPLLLQSASRAYWIRRSTIGVLIRAGKFSWIVFGVSWWTRSIIMSRFLRSTWERRYIARYTIVIAFARNHWHAVIAGTAMSFLHAKDPHQWCMSGLNTKNSAALHCRNLALPPRSTLPLPCAAASLTLLRSVLRVSLLFSFHPFLSFIFRGSGERRLLGISWITSCFK